MVFDGYIWSFVAEYRFDWKNRKPGKGIRNFHNKLIMICLLQAQAKEMQVDFPDFPILGQF